MSSKNPAFVSDFPRTGNGSMILHSVVRILHAVVCIAPAWEQRPT
jgi:hypothetical protein